MQLGICKIFKLKKSNIFAAMDIQANEWKIIFGVSFFLFTLFWVLVMLRGEDDAAQEANENNQHTQA